ncbi:MAG: preprotein translocase subunit YajC [Bacteroidaceae bacterium]|nr:preprotein translocase subunit YajC [Bacteroidaceae bacterium]
MLLSINLLQAGKAAASSASAAGASAQGSQQGSQWSFWIMIIAIFAIMYFFMIRPQKNRQKKIEEFRRSLGVGSQVVTAGGLHGTIREVNDANGTVVLEIAQNVKITIEKSSIYANASSAAEAQGNK